ncbi:hypothetical protein GUJ93_ZPchr0010g9763 [Zizania palustris]|uniref:Uncharacterized protein n=1 Tax=Zizania palustris TaxID=103762 RepID=A0A8J6BHG1_ZIZPA|nr:hypothetical protein GUJ93_ZPchr0010g9763 [Zizania palustris]
MATCSCIAQLSLVPVALNHSNQCIVLLTLSSLGLAHLIHGSHGKVLHKCNSLDMLHLSHHSMLLVPLSRHRDSVSSSQAPQPCFGSQKGFGSQSQPEYGRTVDQHDLVLKSLHLEIMLSKVRTVLTLDEDKQNLEVKGHLLNMELPGASQPSHGASWNQGGYGSSEDKMGHGDPQPSRAAPRAGERAVSLAVTAPSGSSPWVGPEVYMEVGASLKMEDANVVDCDVDIVSPDGGDACRQLEKAEDPDATECSSSFGDTLSGSEDDARPSEISDIEVDSPFCRYPSNGDAAALMDAAVSDNMGRLLKKKRVTDHWRTYISPLMWRCQWLELRMKDLQSQVSRYDRELAALKHEKELQTKMIELDCSSSRSVPFSSQCCRKTMKRRKRKRSEENMNVSSYISNHTIFSYYEKTETDGHSIDDDGNTADDSTPTNNDTDLLLGIKRAMAKKSKGATLKVNTHINGAQSSSCSPGKVKVSDILEKSPMETSDCDIDNAAMPESALSSYGEDNNMDIFESTMNLLSAEGPHQMGEFHQSSEDVLIDNQAAEEGYKNFEVISQPCKKLRISVRSETGAHSADESVAPTVVEKKKEEAHEEATTSLGLQGALKPCYTGKRKERKPKIEERGGSSVFNSGWRNYRLRKKK